MVGSAVACGSSTDDTESDTPVGTTDEGVWYDRALWPHDGDRIETANFVVFSDDQLEDLTSTYGSTSPMAFGMASRRPCFSSCSWSADSIHIDPPRRVDGDLVPGPV